jgi:hypothetical protein
LPGHTVTRLNERGRPQALRLADKLAGDGIEGSFYIQDAKEETRTLA